MSNIEFNKAVIPFTGTRLVKAQAGERVVETTGLMVESLADKYGGHVELNPVNTRDVIVPSCEIQIPFDNVEAVCLAMLVQSGKLQSFCEKHFNIDIDE